VELLEQNVHDGMVGISNNNVNGLAPFVAELRIGSSLADGVWRVSRTPLLDDEMQDSATLWTVRDITQQKMAEEMRNQFVFTATHELRTPLANIRAYAETLAVSDNIDIADQKNFYNIINNEATRLSRFVDELLNVSQMEAGSVTLTCGETDVERLLKEVIDNLKPQIQQKELQFETQFAAKLPKLRVDKDKVVAALVNLLGNAVKYTANQGTVRFLVEVDEAQICFHVEDTGIGISPEELPRLSEKFFRSSDSRVQNIVGSGLGLAFSQEVARLHRGRITVKSELNKGSRFTLSLPLS
jgi:two-component system phosphate regulon sensor histidine kinase PhoR